MVLAAVSVMVAFSASPPVALLLNQLLGTISSLGIIIHFVCINLDYPLRMQLFFGGLFPLITFDPLPTDIAYNYLFETQSFEDDQALTEQFDIVGYSSRLVYDNMGSLLTFMLLQPVSLIFAYITLWALKYTKKYPRLIDLLKHTIRDKIDGFLYNGLIAFYSTNYMVLSVIGNITRKDFGKNDSLNFSSFISWVLTIFSVSFPLILTFLLGRKYVTESLSKEDKSLR